MAVSVENASSKMAVGREVSVARVQRYTMRRSGRSSSVYGVSRVKKFAGAFL